MPFYFSKTLKTATFSALFIGLTACGTLPEKPKSDQAKPVVKPEPVVKQKTAPEVVESKAYSLEELKLLRSKASELENWPDYLNYSTQIWHLSSDKPSLQEQIEDQAWSIINSLSAFDMQQIENHPAAEVQAWSTLQQTFTSQPEEFQQNLQNLQSFESDAIYQKHLVGKLLAQQPLEQEIKQIAVLLPMQEKYKVVSQQIRDGIMKAFFASEQTITLKFYDSSDIENLEAIYTLAKQEGANRIIGPLRKEALQELASFHDDKLLALNNIEGSSFTQFSFKAANPNLQMLNRFETSGYERVGILTNDAQKSQLKAQQMANLWNQQHHAEVSIYPNDKPRLREALGALIHEKQSKARKNNLRWLIGRDLSFFPRTRQDLDAIVIYDNAHRMAVFRPQFDFFELDTPVYSDSQLTPKNFQKIAINKDLNKVQFLTYPATLAPVDLKTKFEAFGWDSYQISTNIEALKNGACLTDAKTGVLSLDGNQIKQSLVWAHYNRQGQLTAAPTPIAKVQPLVPVESEANVTGTLPTEQNMPIQPNQMQPLELQPNHQN